MRALVLNAVNTPLSFQEMPMPMADKDSEIIELHYAALNHRDLWIRKGQYAGICTPMILGSDGAGLLRNNEVIINPSVNWGAKQAHQGDQFSVLGLPHFGTFAQYIAIPKAQIFSKPEHLTLAQAAALPLAGITAYRAVFSQARVKKTDRVLVTGIGGGVAMMALQFLIANGNHVWVTSSSQDKIEAAIQMGARGGSLYTQADWHKIMKINKLPGFDVVIDGSAGPQFTQAITLCNPGARIAIYGGTAGAIEHLSPQMLFWRQLHIVGSTMGSPRDFTKMLAFVQKHRIVPIVSHEFGLEQGNDALDLMEKGQQSGKITLKFV